MNMIPFFNSRNIITLDDLNDKFYKKIKKEDKSDKTREYILGSTKGLRAVSDFLKCGGNLCFMKNRLFTIFIANQPIDNTEEIIVHDGEELIMAKKVPMHLQKPIGRFLYYYSLEIELATENQKVNNHVHDKI